MNKIPVSYFIHIVMMQEFITNYGMMMVMVVMTAMMIMIGRSLQPLGLRHVRSWTARNHSSVHYYIVLSFFSCVIL
jgi:hypothetical protein